MRRLSLSALVLGLMAGGAHADVTAGDVWRDWQSYLAGFGYEVTGTPQRGAGRLVIADLGLTQDIPEAGGRMEMRLGRIELAERADGTVSVIYPETMPMAIAVTPTEGEAVTAVLTLRHEGLAITASGTPEALRYDYTADDLWLDLGEVTVDGEPVEGLEAGMRLAGLAGSSRAEAEAGGAARLFTQDVTAGPVSYSVTFEEPAEAAAFDYAGEAQSLGYAARMRFPTGTDTSDMAAALAAGLSMEGTFRLGAGESRFSATEEGETMRGSSRSAGSTLGGRFSAQGLDYELGVTGLATEVQAETLPLPMAYEIAGLTGRLSMPVARTEATQDFSLVLDLDDLRLSDALWSLFDPNATLPRDPADLALDLSGRGRLTTDIFDQEKMAALAETGEAPGEIERLELNRLLLSLAGARLTGEGAVDIGEAAGMEMPPAEGTVDLRLEGGNALLDRLVALGLVPEDQATMVRMMAGMFAQAAEGEDTLTSRVEVKKDGSLTVNGQKLR